MAGAIEMACPECEETLRIPPAVFGKKIKCKLCGHAFLVPDPAAKASKGGKPVKPGKPEAKPDAKPDAKKSAASPTPAEPKDEANKSDWDDEGAQDVKLIQEEDVALCPNCAKPLDPPTALVCLECGFNSLTRARAETKRVWAPDAMDWFMHLLPGIICLVVGIGLVVFNIISAMSMRDWLSDTFLESDEKDAAGRKKMYVAPGAFIFAIFFITLGVMVPCFKFAFKRLALEYKPVEKVRADRKT